MTPDGRQGVLPEHLPSAEPPRNLLQCHRERSTLMRPRQGTLVSSSQLSNKEKLRPREETGRAQPRREASLGLHPVYRPESIPGRLEAGGWGAPFTSFSSGRASEQARGSRLPLVGSDGVLLPLTSLQGSCPCRSLVGLPARLQDQLREEYEQPSKQAPNSSWRDAKVAQRDSGFLSSGDSSKELGARLGVTPAVGASWSLLIERRRREAARFKINVFPFAQACHWGTYIRETWPCLARETPCGRESAPVPFPHQSLSLKQASKFLTIWCCHEE